MAKKLMKLTQEQTELMASVRDQYITTEVRLVVYSPWGQVGNQVWEATNKRRKT